MRTHLIRDSIVDSSPRVVPNQCTRKLLVPLPTPVHSKPLSSTGTQPVTDRFMYEMPTLQTPGHSRPPPRTGTQPVTDRFMYEQPTLPTQVHSRPRTGTQLVYDIYIPPQAYLVGTVEQLQFEIDALKFAPPCPLMSAMRAPPVQPRPPAFTTTKVLKISG